jgi:hypothetical protein
MLSRGHTNGQIKRAFRLIFGQEIHHTTIGRYLRRVRDLIVLQEYNAKKQALGSRPA